MFKGQPKGRYALALANTGERFGYYTMLAVFTVRSSASSISCRSSAVFWPTSSATERW